MAQTEQRSTTTNRAFSADLLTRLVSNKHHFAEPKARENEDDGDFDEEIELSLGLSLNGRFGTDTRAKNDSYSQSLKRSSSISDFTLTNQAAARESSLSELGASHVSHELGRTCSMPVETEEEWRRRKEIQSLRRLEAKRKRSEKQNNKVARLMVEAPVFVGSIPKDVVLHSQMSFQRSAGSSLGSGSSGLSESDSLTAQGGGNKCSEPSVHSMPESDKVKITAGSTIARFRSGGDINGQVAKIQYSGEKKKGALGRTGSREIAGSRNVMEDMPCVSTTGLGPTGKRIEGFLYRYSKGEEVRIVCVCHGSFLSPAEFVKHAGGTDVDHPLKHIVVNPTSFL